MSVSTSLAFEHLLLVNYAVPPERVRQLVPPELTLDTVAGADGSALALVSAVAFHAWTASSPAGISLRLETAQLNIRTYVQPSGRSVYFIRADVGSRPLGMLGEIAMRGAAPAPILLAPDFDEETGRYLSYEVRCFSPAGEVELMVGDAEVECPPPLGFESWQSAGAFFADRPVGFASSTFGMYFRLDVEHPPLNPMVGRLIEGRLRSLERLGIISREEAASPHSVFLKRRATFEVYPPRPIFLPSGLRD
jgi:hypothetical protein